MMPDSSNNLIRKWLSQRLSKDEAKNLKKEWDDNDQLIEDVANEVVREYARVELKKKLDLIHHQTFGEKKQNSWIFWAILTSTIFAIPLCYLLFFNKPSPEKIFAQHFEVYPDITTFSGEAQPIDKAMDFYSSGNYPQAIITMENALVNDAFNLQEYHFYLGISYLANNNPDRAIDYLQKNISSDNEFIQQARWYLALAYLKKNDKVQSEKLLKEISSQPGAYKQKEATEILKKW